MTEEERERLNQIQTAQVERHKIFDCDVSLMKREMRADIDFLLSLLDSQAVSIPYCLNCWHAVPHSGPAGTVDDACTHEGCDCGYYQPAPLNDTATAMRDACVEKVKSIQAEHGRTPVDSEDYEYDQAVAWALCRVTRELESLTPEREKQS